MGKDNKYDWLFNDDEETPRNGTDQTTNANTGNKNEETNLTDTL